MVVDVMFGYIALHRELIQKPIFQNEKLLKVWIWCLIKASHKGREQLVGLQKIKLLPGQFVTGRIAGSRELNLKQSTFWDYLLWLKKNQSIDIKSDNKKTIVTLLNWGRYQCETKYSDSKLDRCSTASRQLADTNNNVKNEKNNSIRPNLKITDEHRSLAAKFRAEIRCRKPDYVFRGSEEKWADCFRLMIEKDNRTTDQISAVINWAQADSFWQDNILSPDKLRKQFDRLEMQMAKSYPAQVGKPKQYDENGILIKN